MTALSDHRPLKFSKFGLSEDPTHLHVLADYQGRRLLGDVKRFHRNEVTGAVMLHVHHFCGDPWPVYPCAASFVRVI